MNYLISVINIALLLGALAALQGLLLNRMRLAFAAAPAFLGLGAYALGAGSVSFWLASLILVTIFGLALALSWLARLLPEDHYLLATLAILEMLNGLSAMPEALGGREGLATLPALPRGGAGYELRVLPWVLLSATLVGGWCFWLQRQAIFIAIDRFRENPQNSSRWFPLKRLQFFMVTTTALLCASLGLVYAYYQGRVAPNIFSIDTAITILIFTILAGRRVTLAIPAALLYWIFPFIASQFFSLSQQWLAELVRFAWASLTIAMVYLSFGKSSQFLPGEVCR